MEPGQRLRELAAGLVVAPLRPLRFLRPDLHSPIGRALKGLGHHEHGRPSQELGISPRDVGFDVRREALVRV